MKSAYEHSKELIQKCSPSMSYEDGDFEEWKIVARNKLSQLLGMDKFEKVNPDFAIEYQKKIDGAQRFGLHTKAKQATVCLVICGFPMRSKIRR